MQVTDSSVRNNQEKVSGRITPAASFNSGEDMDYHQPTAFTYRRCPVLRLEQVSFIMLYASILLFGIGYIRAEIRPYLTDADGAVFFVLESLLSICLFALPVIFMTVSAGVPSETLIGRALIRGQVPWILLMSGAAVFAVTGFQMIWTVMMQRTGIPYSLDNGTSIPLWLSIPFAGILVPVSEELLFRGAMLPAMERRWGRAAGLLVSAGIFALMHGSVHRLPYSFALGLLLAMIMIRSGSLFGAVLFHGVYNSASLILKALAAAGRGAVTVNPYAQPANWPGIILLGSFLLLIGGLFLGVFAVGFTHRCPTHMPALMRDGDDSGEGGASGASYLPMAFIVSIFFLMLRLIWTTLEIWP